MTYARARLWLGISGVGFFVIASAIALWFDLPQRALAGRSSIAALALTLATYILLSFPGDLLGGLILPVRYGRSSLTFAAFLASWARGVVLQSVVMGLCAYAILRSALAGGPFLALGAFVVLMLILVQAQLLVASLVGSLRQTKSAIPAGTHNPLNTLVYESTDPAFVGGLVGIPGRETLVLPAAWLQSLPPDVVAMQIARRLGAVATGTRTRGLLVALIWNTAGFFVASRIPNVDAATAPGLVSLALWFTLWSFVGLLLLPTINRPGVLQADRYAVDNGVSAQTMLNGMVQLDRLQDDEPQRSRWIERVFHPIPSVNSRMEALTQGVAHSGAWQGARVTLYLSWAGMGLLSRAVHCNVGRPELWVLFPGD